MGSDGFCLWKCHFNLIFNHLTCFFGKFNQLVSLNFTAWQKKRKSKNPKIIGWKYVSFDVVITNSDKCINQFHYLVCALHFDFHAVFIFIFGCYCMYWMKNVHFCWNHRRFFCFCSSNERDESEERYGEDAI